MEKSRISFICTLFLLLLGLGCTAVQPRSQTTTQLGSGASSESGSSDSTSSGGGWASGNSGGSESQSSTSTEFPSKDPAGIFDGSGHFSTEAYVSMAQQYGTSPMIPERFGKPWTAYHSTLSLPTVWKAPSIFYQNPSNHLETFYYSLGNACTKDDYSSNYAQVAYITDPKNADTIPGVDEVATLEKFSCMWAGLPQSYWAMGSGHPAVTLRQKTLQLYDPYGTPKQPVDVARAYGASEAAGCSYMVFQDGQIICGRGGNTVHDYFYIKPFPSHFVPTAASVTNNGEFLLVTGWNTTTYIGQLAVIALGGSQPKGSFWNYEWDELYPGFRNYSIPTFSKLLGIIDLPGMRAPTAIEVVGNWVYEPGAYLPVKQGQPSDYGLPGHFSLSDQSNWQCFASGECTQLFDTAGFALIASRYEREVMLVDLTPLFQIIQKGMFTSFSEFRANVANTGTKNGQWPPTFAEDRTEIPTLVKTISFSREVTAISASLYPDDRALIATEDGHLHVWDVNGLQTGKGTGANAKEIYDLSGIGSNVTRLTHMKHWRHAHNNGGNVQWQYITVSRGDKVISWIDFSTSTPTIVRKLRDSRLSDPISVEDNNNHGTQSDLIDIADYGDSTVKGYRYGPVTFWTTPGSPTYGMGPKGNDSLEYEGSYKTPAGPFAISIENVP